MSGVPARLLSPGQGLITNILLYKVATELEAIQ
jgi:hypothetical protein